MRNEETEEKLSTLNLPHQRGGFVLLCLILCWVATLGYPTNTTAKSELNPIEAENLLLGTDDWLITNPSNNFEVSGYAGRTSINKGDSLDLYISSTSSQVSLTAYRLGWYDGKGARQMSQPVTISATQQSVPSPNSNTGLLDLNWRKSYSLHTGPDWVTGSYLIKLKANGSGKQAYIPFTLRDDNRPADIAFQHSVTTWQAYNNFGGKSIYSHNSTNGNQANIVSFNRPYVDGFGSGELLKWEYQMIRWLEKEGYDVTYVTNIDTHQSANQLRIHKSFLSVGHDEYWSWEMRDHVELLKDNGVNLGFFTANAAYWQIRLESSSVANGNNRTMVAYRYDAASRDPILKDGSTQNDHLVTGLFRAPPTNRPEETLMGVMYGLFPVDDEDMIITNADHWIFANSGLKNNDVIPNVMGYEVDGIYGYGPDNLEILASTPLKHPTTPSRNLTSYMTIYETEQDAHVFATGTIQWSWGLDNFVRPYGGSRNFKSFAAEQVTRNVLNTFISGERPDEAPTETATSTQTLVPTSTTTATPTTTKTAVPTATATPTNTKTAVPTATSTPNPSQTTVATATATHTPSPTIDLLPNPTTPPDIQPDLTLLYLPIVAKTGPP